jgi:hypothetical protein
MIEWWVEFQNDVTPSPYNDALYSILQTLSVHSHTSHTDITYYILCLQLIPNPLLLYMRHFQGNLSEALSEQKNVLKVMEQLFGVEVRTLV